ncbi:Synaptotagmin 1 [Gryllus bimaculatus]|nr:Synaptotagmin 1 [Gryllus bimaculatus]
MLILCQDPTEVGQLWETRSYASFCDAVALDEKDIDGDDGNDGSDKGHGVTLHKLELIILTTPALVGICLGATLFLVTVAAVTCFCYRRHSRVLGGAGGGRKKEPRGGRPECSELMYTVLQAAGSNTPSPTTNVAPPQAGSSPVQENVQKADPGSKEQVAFHTENEVKDKPTTPSKEELETNEKNLTNTDPNDRKLGQLVFKLRHDYQRDALIVSVVKCNDLPASDPYVRIQILPDKKKKKNTRVLRNTRNPVYDEDITFYQMNYEWLKESTIHFLVMSFDRYSRDDVIGEVFCPLDSVDLTQIKNQSLTFCREIQPRSLKTKLLWCRQIRSTGRGELLVSLCWLPCANRLTVVVLKARNLPNMDVTGLADPYVKIYLLYNDHRIAKKKTHVKTGTLNPVFNESFTFTIPPGADGLDNVSLEFLLMDWDRITKNEVIGRLTLGSSKCSGSALHHWNIVNNSPRRQIADWHKLEG